MNELTNENEILEVSKSQRKREANALLQLARQLADMPASLLSSLPLDAELRAEIEFARNIRARGARKRQVMTVAKMLRQRDNQELLDAIEQIDQNNRRESARFHLIEAWRDRLINGDDTDLSSLLDQSNAAHAQTLRQLIRNAKKDVRLQKPPVAARKLFRLLREMDGEQPLPPL